MRRPAPRETDRRSVHTRCYKEQYAVLEADGRTSARVIEEWYECWRLLNPDLGEREVPR